MNIILVDDEEFTIKGMAHLLKANFAGCNILGTFGDAGNAFNFIRGSNEVDVVITDIKMPGADGLSLINSIKELKRDIYIIALSAYSEYEYVRAAMVNGAMDYLLKPCKTADILNLFQKIESGKQQGSESQDISDNPQLPRYIRDALKFINVNYMKDISLKEVSDHVFMNSWYFSAQFKKIMKLSMVDYLNSVRIESAKNLLADNNLKIYQVAEMTGYSDPTYFSTVFKHITALSPKDYRKQLYDK